MNCDKNDDKIKYEESESFSISDSSYENNIYTIGEVCAVCTGHDDYNMHICYNYSIKVD